MSDTANTEAAEPPEVEYRYAVSYNGRYEGSFYAEPGLTDVVARETAWATFGLDVVTDYNLDVDWVEEMDQA
jgi:hypothetical protein